MIRANEALEISKQYQAVQEYITEIDKCIQAAAVEGKTTCYYKIKPSIDIGDTSYYSCDIIVNYLKQNGYKTVFRAMGWIDLLELEISWKEEQEEDNKC